MSRGRLFALPLVLLVMAACDTGGNAARPAPSVTVWPTGSPLAVYDGSTANASSHTVSVVGFITVGVPSPTAKVLASVTLRKRTDIPFGGPPCLAFCLVATDPPYVSTSETRVYVLDGNTTVDMLASNGSLTKITSIPGTETARAAFAVSPDDAKIAVGIIDFVSQTNTLYIEKLEGGGRVDVLTRSGAHFYWPIGWRGSQILLATGTNTGTFQNPYDARDYALIDPIAGAQPVALGNGDCVPTGTVNGAGTACIAKPGTPCLEEPVSNTTGTSYYSCLRRISWAGSETNFLLPNNSYTSALAVDNAALSPDGQTIMTDELARVHAPLSATNGGNMFLGSASTGGQPNLRMGWISNEYFSTSVMSADGSSTQNIVVLNPPDDNAIRGVPFAGAAPTVGSLVGTLPGGL